MSSLEALVTQVLTKTYLVLGVRLQPDCSSYRCWSDLPCREGKVEPCMECIGYGALVSFSFIQIWE